ncbi:hypothetical protein [Paracoccus sp. S3-43]|uniref:hypothetical protein n=1 Tax=Paracoccus sp. S3-43 TaxID=3030011 RepID=UPI0023AF4DD2|nr:hypothetical protein [Paracoccus sp. S3-43]WEF24169.1 hypothetical protein PXD02_15525 [Paracoccus sp. S3-43]
MKATFTWVASGAFLALTAVSAQADCAAELARLTEGGTATEGISKDGSLAPLEGASEAADADAAATEAVDTAEAAGMNSAAPTDGASAEGASTDGVSAEGTASPDTAAAEGGEGIAKDGTHVPLEGASGQQAGVAMSGADAQAQQEGQPTAAEQADGGAMDHSGRDAHLQAARDALAAGNEDACMEAVKAAQSS